VNNREIAPSEWDGNTNALRIEVGTGQKKKMAEIKKKGKRKWPVGQMTIVRENKGIRADLMRGVHTKKKKTKVTGPKVVAKQECWE